MKLRKKKGQLIQALEEVKKSTTEPEAEADPVSKNKIPSPNPQEKETKTDTKTEPSDSQVPETISSGPSVEQVARDADEPVPDAPVPDAPVPSGPTPATTDSSRPFRSGSGKAPKDLQKRVVTIERLCHGHKFPVQLMLVIKSKIAKDSIWWSSEGDGNTFVIDCAWFKDSVMKQFFPGNPFKRITLALKKW